MENPLQKYEVKNRLGKGAYGDVFLVKRKDNGESMALKLAKTTSQRS